jgi:hypothetical protein
VRKRRWFPWQAIGTNRECVCAAGQLPLLLPYSLNCLSRELNVFITKGVGDYAPGVLVAIHFVVCGKPSDALDASKMKYEGLCTVAHGQLSQWLFSIFYCNNICDGNLSPDVGNRL